MSFWGVREGGRGVGDQGEGADLPAAHIPAGWQG